MVGVALLVLIGVGLAACGEADAEREFPGDGALEAQTQALSEQKLASHVGQPPDRSDLAIWWLRPQDEDFWNLGDRTTHFVVARMVARSESVSGRQSVGVKVHSHIRDRACASESGAFRTGSGKAERSALAVDLAFRSGCRRVPIARMHAPARTIRCVVSVLDLDLDFFVDVAA